MDATLWLMSATTTASTVDIKDSILDAIGATPLVRLSRLGAGLTPQIVAKVESLNPGGSIKDRVAVALIEAAERDGKLKPGGTIVEPTSGNTGTGLAIAARLKGYRVIAVMPDKVSREKIDLLRAYGAEVTVCPVAVPPEHPASYYSTAERLVRELPDSFRPNQYANPANPLSHEKTTGPEIWRQSGGRVTHFVAGAGTCGTITGTAMIMVVDRPSSDACRLSSPFAARAAIRRRPRADSRPHARIRRSRWRADAARPERRRQKAFRRHG
jgi:cystathionine beta-synthase